MAAANGGAECPALSQSQSCNAQACPTDAPATAAPTDMPTAVPTATPVAATASVTTAPPANDEADDDDPEDPNALLETDTRTHLRARFRRDEAQVSEIHERLSIAQQLALRRHQAQGNELLA